MSVERGRRSIAESVGSGLDHQQWASGRVVMCLAATTDGPSEANPSMAT